MQVISAARVKAKQAKWPRSSKDLKRQSSGGLKKQGSNNDLAKKKKQSNADQQAKQLEDADTWAHCNCLDLRLQTIAFAHAGACRATGSCEHILYMTGPVWSRGEAHR